MSPDKVTDARMKYADLSFEDLKSKAFKVTELRKIAREVGISKIYQDNQEISVDKGRKQELAKAIYEACEVYKVSHEVEEIEEIEKTAEQPMSSTEENQYHSYEEELDEVANRYYNGVFDATVSAYQEPWILVGLKECVTRQLAQSVPFVPEFFTLISRFKPELEQRVKERSDDEVINPNTLHNWRALVLKRIEKMVAKDASQFPEDSLKKAYKLFYDSIQATFVEVRKVRSAITTTNLNQRGNNFLQIQIFPLIQWAKDTVVNLPESPTRWREVAVALMVLTGRRQSEIMSSAKFESVGASNRVLFSGQLKKHSGEVSGAFEIPVLGNCADAVIAALEWLTKNGKRALPVTENYEDQQIAAKQAHNNYSRYLSEEAKKVCDKYIRIEESKSWDLERESGKIKDRRNCHLFRQIYGQIVYEVFFAKSGRKKNQILTEVMGHADTKSSRRFAAENYDADVEVADVELISKI